MDSLTVHTRAGIVRVPLSGDKRLDSLLAKWAARGGTVLREDGALVEDADERAALRDGL